MAGRTGLEPAASGVTGRRYNRLNYDPYLAMSKNHIVTGVFLVGGTRLELVTPGL